MHLNGPAFLKKLAPHPIHPYDQGHWGAFSIKPSSTFLFFRAGQETPKIVVSNEFFRETSTQCNWTQRAPCDSVAKPPSLLHLQISTKPSVVTVQIGRPMYIYFVVAHWLYHPPLHILHMYAPQYVRIPTFCVIFAFLLLQQH